MITDARSVSIPGDSSESTYTTTADDLARYRRYLRAFETNKQDEVKEAQLHRKYYHDKQWTDAELRKLSKRNQPPVTDNGIKRKIDFLVGVEQRMRRDPKAYPRTPKHEHDADVATAGIRFVCDQQRWGQVSSDGLHDGLVSGIGIAWVGVKPGRDGNDVDLKRVDPARFVYDSRSIKPDFSDARWMGVDLWMDIDEAKEGVDPEKAKALDGLIDNTRMGTLSSLPADADQATQWGDFERRRVRIVELYELRAMPPYNKAAWHFCKFSGEIALEAMISPYLDANGLPDNPYIAWSPYIDEMGNRYGPIRSMKSIQDEINHRRSRFLHELNSRQTFSNRGGSVEDVDKFKEEIARPDGHLEFAGGEWGKDVGIIDRSQQLKGHFDLLQESQARLENYGPNPGLIGRGGGIADQSGRAILAQRDAGMTELSPVFERQRDWKLRVYRAIWGRIRQAWTGAKWIAVTDDPDATEYVQVNGQVPVMMAHPVTGEPVPAIDPMTGAPQMQAQNAVAEIDVDILLEEGPDMVVMREELMQTMTSLGEAAMGPLGKVIIELSNVSNKEQLLKMLDEATQPPPDVAALNARMAELEAMIKSANVENSVASAGDKRAAALQKLVTALQGTPAETNEFGQVTKPAQTPNLGLAMALLHHLEQMGPQAQPPGQEMTAPLALPPSFREALQRAPIAPDSPRTFGPPMNGHEQSSVGMAI